MDKNQRFRKLSMGLIVPLLFCIAFFVGEILCFGFDSATSCTPNGKTSRRGRAQLIAAIPCDLSMRGYCHLPGTAYPWHAVRRFVHENHGLIKRMYGDVRHIRILRDEIQNNEIDIEDMAETAARYSRDGARRSSKYLQNGDAAAESYGNLRNNEVLMEPYFRPLATASSSAATPTGTATTTATNMIATETSRNPATSSRPTIATTNATTTTTETTTTTKTTTATGNITGTLEAEAEVEATEAAAEVELVQKFTKVPEVNEKNQSKTQYSDTIERHRLQQLDDVEITDDDDNDESNHRDKGSLVSNSVYESPSPSQESVTVLGENIQIVQSPELGSKNISSTSLAATDDMVTISTTLKSSTTTVREENVLPPSSVIIDKNQSVPVPAPTTTTLLSMRIATKRNESESIAAAFLKLATLPPLRPIKNGTLSLLSNSSSSSSNNNSSGSGAFNKNQWLAATLAKTTNTLFSGETIRTANYTNYTTPMQAINVSSAPKPVIQDPQLHQDTIQKEQDSRINMRGVNACPVKQEVVAPFWANNTRGKVLALLNVYPFEQYVHFEKCTHERKQMYCRDGCRCEQQYHLHRLLAYDVLDECRGIFSDWFRFPSSCICKCYGYLFEFRATSRSPRRSADVHNDEEVAAMLAEDEDEKEVVNHRHPIDEAEAALKKAIYDHAVDDWYRPRDDLAAAAPAV